METLIFFSHKEKKGKDGECFSVACAFLCVHGVPLCTSASPVPAETSPACATPYHLNAEQIYPRSRDDGKSRSQLKWIGNLVQGGSG